MRKHSVSLIVMAALSAALASAGGCAAPSASDQPGAQEQPMADRSNYIVSLEAGAGDISTPEGVERARQELDLARDRVLTDVFGADGYAAAADGRSGLPHYGQSFISAYAFEIRLTADEARRLAGHDAVRTLEEDVPARPMGARSDG
tara:strand:+ start:1365 stop:1805 length:441 start_codon:yes stop_codon:yes gene_type:complete